MRPLKEVLESLNRELASVSATPSESRGGTVERATVRLEAVLQDGPNGMSWWVRSELEPIPEGVASATRIGLELQIARPGSAPAPSAVSAAASSSGSSTPHLGPTEPTPGSGSAAGEAPVERLAGVLGAPGGFAAYCRADTLATALESLRDGDWEVFVAALEESHPKDLDPVVQAAWGTVRNALRSGPAGSVEAGLDRIRGPLRHWSRTEWIRILRERWRNEPAPIPDPPGLRVDAPSSRN